MARLVREYNRSAAEQPAPEAWERAMWWQTDLRAQVEYYFSDKSLRTERYFREAIVGKEDGWLDMETVKAHPRMMHCGVSVQEELLDALKDSKCVDTKAEDGKAFVRRLGGKPLPNLEEPRKRRFGGGEVPPWGKRRTSNSDDPTCWDFVRRGVCPRGDRCRYLHSAPEEGAEGAGGAVSALAEGDVSSAVAPADAGAPADSAAEAAESSATTAAAAPMTAAAPLATSGATATTDTAASTEAAKAAATAAGEAGKKE